MNSECLLVLYDRVSDAPDAVSHLRRHDPAGGSFAPVRLAAFRWNRWQTSAVYAAQTESMVQPNGVTDELGRKPVSLVDVHPQIVD